MSELLLTDMGVGEAIREYLTVLGEGTPYGFFKVWRQFKKKTSYAAVRKIFWVLKTIELIESVRFEKSISGFRKHFYHIIPGKETHPAWRHPQIELWPDTQLGSEGYAKMREKGLKPKGGRRKQYR